MPGREQRLETAVSGLQRGAVEHLVETEGGEDARCRAESADHRGSSRAEQPSGLRRPRSQPGGGGDRHYAGHDQVGPHQHGEPDERADGGRVGRTHGHGHGEPQRAGGDVVHRLHGLEQHDRGRRHQGGGGHASCGRNQTAPEDEREPDEQRRGERRDQVHCVAAEHHHERRDQQRIARRAHRHGGAGAEGGRQEPGGGRHPGGVGPRRLGRQHAAWFHRPLGEHPRHQRVAGRVRPAHGAGAPLPRDQSEHHADRRRDGRPPVIAGHARTCPGSPSAK